MLLSTGMSNFNEIEKTINLMNKFGISKKKLFCYNVILHILQIYITQTNVLKTFKKEFNVKVGYSDHTEDLNALLCCCTEQNISRNILL